MRGTLRRWWTITNTGESSNGVPLRAHGSKGITLLPVGNGMQKTGRQYEKGTDMAADYTVNYAEVDKQHSQLSEQLDQLSKILDDMASVQETMLGAAQWSAEDKQEFTDRFNAFLEGGRKLHQTGVSEAETLKKVSEAYHAAEQH